MIYIYYASIYLMVGVGLMAVLDFMYNRVKDLVDEEFKNGYNNWKRIYIIAVWPFFLVSLLREMFRS